MNEILKIIAYTQNAGSVFTASTGSVGLMLANDETHRNRIGLIWQKNNRQYPKSGDKDGHKDGCEVGYKYGHAVPVFSNHKYLIRKMIKAVR